MNMKEERRGIDMKGKLALLCCCVGLILLASNVSIAFAQPDPDINNDGKVDIKDVAIAALAFGSYPGHPRWNPDVDLDADSVITIKDIRIVAFYFGT